MRVVNPEINFSSGLVTLRFPITSLELREVRQKRIFNFQEILFQKDLPITSFREAFITIISDSINVIGFDESTEFNDQVGLELESDKWQILSLEFDDIIYPTFYLLRKQGKLQGSLVQAMMNFAVDRSTQNENLSSASKHLVIESVSDFIKLGIDGISEEHGIEKNLKKVLSGIGDLYNREQYRLSVENFLTFKDIPFDCEENSYYFSANSSSFSWGAELSLLEDVEGITLYSYIQLELEEAIVDSLLRDLNSINQSLSFGNFQFSIEEQVLYYRNNLNIRVIDLEENLEKLFQDNFDSIRSISSLLQDKYCHQIKIVM